MSDRQDTPSRTWFGVPGRIAGGFALAIASLGVSAGFSFAALSARAEEHELASQAAACEVAVEEVEAALLSAGSSLASYVEESEPRRLQEYGLARARVEEAVAALVLVARGNPREEPQLPPAKAAVSHVLAEHSEVLALATAGDRAGAHALHAGEPVASAVARANRALQHLESAGMRAAVEGSRSRAKVITIWTAVFVVAEVLLLVLIGVAARTVRDEIRAREQAMQVQQRLMGIVSHDLRNPLSAVLGSAWSLGRAELPEDARRAARRIASAARRMHRLIRDVLDWSRAHAGAPIPLAPTCTDVSQLCTGVIEDLDRPAGERIRLACEGDTHAAVDPDRMEQVIANLLSNALRYAPPGRPVSVRIAGGPEDISIAVTDEGPGIAPDVRARLFEPFHQAPPGDARAGGGVGLGLFIVHTIAEAHGGRVHVHTTPGAGTTFVVQIPRGSAQAGAPAARAKSWAPGDR